MGRMKCASVTVLVYDRCWPEGDRRGGRKGHRSRRRPSARVASDSKGSGGERAAGQPDWGNGWEVNRAGSGNPRGQIPVIQTGGIRSPRVLKIRRYDPLKPEVTTSSLSRKCHFACRPNPRPLIERCRKSAANKAVTGPREIWNRLGARWIGGQEMQHTGLTAQDRKTIC